MVFSTPIFLFYFLALTLLIYYLVPRCLRNPVLLCASLLFYFWGERVYTVIMLLSTAIDYTHGMLVERCKARGNDRGARMAVASSMVFNLALLFFFKYWDFLAGSLQAVGLGFMPVLNIHLPIGISFYTFQTMSYTIDVYRGDARAQHSIINFGTFVTLFPQLIAGPILKYKDLGDQIDQRDCTPRRSSPPACRSSWWAWAKRSCWPTTWACCGSAIRPSPPDQLTMAGAWLGVSPSPSRSTSTSPAIPIWPSALAGCWALSLPPTSDYPYISRSITEFWRRWHISLSSWFREYLYIPLGGNRVQQAPVDAEPVSGLGGHRHLARGQLELSVCGVFISVALLMLEKLFLLPRLEKAPRALQHVYTLFLVVVSWAIFAIEDFAQLRGYLAVMFGVGGVPLADGAFGYYLHSYLPVLCAAVLASTPLGVSLFQKLGSRTRQILCALLVLAGLVLCTAYLVDGTYNPFLYFRF